MASKKTTSKSISTQTILAEVATHLTAALAALKKLGHPTYTSDDRILSNGKLRKGETEAMTNILDVVDAFPGLFASIADKDGGIDDAKVETAPSRAHIELWTQLAPVAALADEVQTLLADNLLDEASRAKDVTVPAYAIIRANAPANAKLKKAASRSTTFYGHSARQRAANEKKKEKSAKKTGG